MINEYTLMNCQLDDSKGGIVIKFTFKFLEVKLYFIVIHVLELRLYGFGL